MTTLKQQVGEAVRKAQDDPSLLVCFYRAHDDNPPYPDRRSLIRCTFAELPVREFDEGFGGREGEPFIGFSERFVYICGTYDGAEWIEAVPRSPEVVEATSMLPVVGGG